LDANEVSIDVNLLTANPDGRPGVGYVLHGEAIVVDAQRRTCLARIAGKVEAVRKGSFTVMSIAPTLLIICALDKELRFCGAFGFSKTFAGFDD
jgi:hypothetical protein